jgi:hypothetical protein
MTLKVEEAQELLSGDEALVFFLTGDMESYVFAVTRDDFDWKVIPLDTNALSKKVAAFRRGLDGDMTEDQNVLDILGKKRELFDLGIAYNLYVALIGPVEALVKGKRSLTIVPSGPLTALPFHLLVTERPVASAPRVKDRFRSEDSAPYRDAAWLIKRQAVTLLPSVLSLKALRAFARKVEAVKPMIGFGDPIFDPAERERAIARQAVTKRQGAVMTRAYTDYWPGAGLDRSKLAAALPTLLNTADELKAVAQKLGAPPNDIHLVCLQHSGRGQAGC